MGGVWTHPQGLLEEFFHNIADAFSYLKGQIKRRLKMGCAFVLRRVLLACSGVASYVSQPSERPENRVPVLEVIETEFDSWIVAVMHHCNLRGD